MLWVGDVKYENHIRTRLKHANERMLEFLKEHFGDPRITLQREATIEDYVKAGIKREERILDLLENDIWPIVIGGPEYAQPVRCGTDYCLEGYTNSGIEAVKTMCNMRDEGITPFHIRNIAAKERRYDLRLNVIRAQRNRYYVIPRNNAKQRKRIDTIEGHAHRYSIVPGMRYIDYFRKAE